MYLLTVFRLIPSALAIARRERDHVVSQPVRRASGPADVALVAEEEWDGVMLASCASPLSRSHSASRCPQANEG